MQICGVARFLTVYTTDDRKLVKLRKMRCIYEKSMRDRLAVAAFHVAGCV